MKSNPWGLTEREAEVMDALVLVGNHKMAARMLGISDRTIEYHSAQVGLRMGLNLNGTIGRKLVLWDRWRRDGRTGDEHLQVNRG